MNIIFLMLCKNSSTALADFCSVEYERALCSIRRIRHVLGTGKAVHTAFYGSLRVFIGPCL